LPDNCIVPFKSDQDSYAGGWFRLPVKVNERNGTAEVRYLLPL
jgi:hypothetical protein